MADTELLCYDEVKVWNLIKKYPDELGFILQEQNYEMYLNTFCEEDRLNVPITEEDFYLVKNFFNNLKENNNENCD